MSLPNYSLRAALSYAAVSCPADVIAATIVSGRDDATRSGHEEEEEDRWRRVIRRRYSSRPLLERNKFGL